MDTKTVSVPNISCGHCVGTIEREVSQLGGVTSVKAEPETRNVTISWDPETIGWPAIENRMREINYPPAG